MAKEIKLTQVELRTLKALATRQADEKIISTKKDLMDYMEYAAKRYLPGAAASTKRNMRFGVPKSIVATVLVDFINHCGTEQGLDLCLRYEHIE